MLLPVEEERNEAGTSGEQRWHGSDEDCSVLCKIR